MAKLVKKIIFDLASSSYRKNVKSLRFKQFNYFKGNTNFFACN